MIYQIIWQRQLLLIYGSNSESVAMVVAAFLIGLGLGSLLGGYCSKRSRIPLVMLFACGEFMIGCYGMLSSRLFNWADSFSMGAGMAMTGLLAFSLVLLPTLLMGATLPLLVAHQTTATGDAGTSVSDLYFVNTLGAGMGAIFASSVLLGTLGLQGTTLLAVLLNLSAALAMLGAWKFERRAA